MLMEKVSTVFAETKHLLVICQMETFALKYFQFI